jgi:hypothetical protein
LSGHQQHFLDTSEVRIAGTSRPRRRARDIYDWLICDWVILFAICHLLLAIAFEDLALRQRRAIVE